MKPCPDALDLPQAELVRAFLLHGHATRAELVRATGWSRAVLSGRLAELVRGGWVEVTERVAAGGLGRPTERLRFRSDAALVEVIECGDVTRMALVTIDGDVVTEDTIPLSVQDPLDIVADRCRAVRDSFAISPSRSVLRTVVSVTAAVDERHRARNSTIHPSWSRQDLVAMLGTDAVPVVVENDANITAFGLAAPDETLLAITVGEGVGSGLVVGGLLQRGTAGVAGEIGHLPTTRTRGRACICGRSDCLLTSATLPAMCRDSGVPADDREPRKLLECALNTYPDTQAAGVVTAVGAELGALLAATVAVAAVERIVISSGSRVVDRALVRGCSDALRALLKDLDARTITVEGGAAADGAVRRGALRLVTNSLLGATL